MWLLAARNALKRKKQHEHSLEQTNGQINMLEQQIYSIESANINQETLVAMKNAGAAMKQIHGKMTMEDVDVTMYVVERGFFPKMDSRRSYVILHPFHHTSAPSILYHLKVFLTDTVQFFFQGTTPRTTRTNARNRQRHHLHAYHRTNRRR